MDGEIIDDVGGTDFGKGFGINLSEDGWRVKIASI